MIVPGIRASSKRAIAWRSYESQEFGNRQDRRTQAEMRYVVFEWHGKSRGLCTCSIIGVLMTFTVRICDLCYVDPGFQRHLDASPIFSATRRVELRDMQFHINQLDSRGNREDIVCRNNEFVEVELRLGTCL